MMELHDQAIDLDAGANDGDVCHLGRERGVAACGAPVDPEAHRGLEYEGQGACPIHGRPICPTCRAIIGSWRRSGEWEGA